MEPYRDRTSPRLSVFPGKACETALGTLEQDGRASSRPPDALNPHAKSISARSLTISIRDRAASPQSSLVRMLAASDSVAVLGSVPVFPTRVVLRGKSPSIPRSLPIPSVADEIELLVQRCIDRVWRSNDH